MLLKIVLLGVRMAMLGAIAWHQLVPARVPVKVKAKSSGGESSA